MTSTCLQAGLAIALIVVAGTASAIAARAMDVGVAITCVLAVLAGAVVCFGIIVIIAED